MKNPNWTREELIIVLDSYMQHDPAWLNRISERSDDVRALSVLLRSLKHFSPNHSEAQIRTETLQECT
jgi:hypothetical protein